MDASGSELLLIERQLILSRCQNSKRICAELLKWLVILVWRKIRWLTALNAVKRNDKLRSDNNSAFFVDSISNMINHCFSDMLRNEDVEKLLALLSSVLQNVVDSPYIPDDSPDVLIEMHSDNFEGFSRFLAELNGSKQEGSLPLAENEIRKSHWPFRTLFLSISESIRGDGDLEGKRCSTVLLAFVISKFPQQMIRAMIECAPLLERSEDEWEDFLLQLIVVVNCAAMRSESVGTAFIEILRTGSIQGDKSTLFSIACLYSSILLGPGFRLSFAQIPFDLKTIMELCQKYVRLSSNLAIADPSCGWLKQFKKVFELDMVHNLNGYSPLADTSILLLYSISFHGGLIFDNLGAAGKSWHSNVCKFFSAVCKQLIRAGTVKLTGTAVQSSENCDEFLGHLLSHGKKIVRLILEDSGAMIIPSTELPADPVAKRLKMSETESGSEAVDMDELKKLVFSLVEILAICGEESEISCEIAQCTNWWDVSVKKRSNSLTVLYKLLLCVSNGRKCDSFLSCWVKNWIGIISNKAESEEVLKRVLAMNWVLKRSQSSKDCRLLLVLEKSLSPHWLEISQLLLSKTKGKSSVVSELQKQTLFTLSALNSGPEFDESEAEKRLKVSLGILFHWLRDRASCSGPKGSVDSWQLSTGLENLKMMIAGLANFSPNCFALAIHHIFNFSFLSQNGNGGNNKALERPHFSVTGILNPNGTLGVPPNFPPQNQQKQTLFLQPKTSEKASEKVERCSGAVSAQLAMLCRALLSCPGPKEGQQGAGKYDAESDSLDRRVKVRILIDEIVARLSTPNDPGLSTRQYEMTLPQEVTCYRHMYIAKTLARNPFLFQSVAMAVEHGRVKKDLLKLTQVLNVVLTDLILKYHPKPIHDKASKFHKLVGAEERRGDEGRVRSLVRALAAVDWVPASMAIVCQYLPSLSEFDFDKLVQIVWLCMRQAMAYKSYTWSAEKERREGKGDGSSPLKGLTEGKEAVVLEEWKRLLLEVVQKNIVFLGAHFRDIIPHADDILGKKRT